MAYEWEYDTIPQIFCQPDEHDPLIKCVRCNRTWPTSELTDGVCPDCHLREWEGDDQC